MSAWFHRHTGWVLPILFGLLLVGGSAGMWVQGDLIWAVNP